MELRSAKDIRIEPITAKAARHQIKLLHYSGTVVSNSQLHFGVFLDGRCGGAMQFGPSLDKRKIMGLVKNTGWNDFIELNRLALADWLPRNSESRAMSVAFRIMKKAYPNIRWVVSFADATQCGDGTIYRAAGFVLTGIKENTQIWESPTGEKISRMSATARAPKKGGQRTKAGASMKEYVEAGWKPLVGHQLRYIKFLDPSARQDLTVPELPFTAIKDQGAKMYLGASSDTSDTPPVHGGKGGAEPTDALHSEPTDPTGTVFGNGEPPAWFMPTANPLVEVLREKAEDLLLKKMTPKMKGVKRG